MESSSRIWRLFTTIIGFTSLVPDFLSLGHSGNKGEINKFTENFGRKLKNFCSVLLSIKHRLYWAFLPNLVCDYHVHGFMGNRKPRTAKGI